MSTDLDKARADRDEAHAARARHLRAMASEQRGAVGPESTFNDWSNDA